MARRRPRRGKRSRRGRIQATLRARRIGFRM